MSAESGRLPSSFSFEVDIEGLPTGPPGFCRVERAGVDPVDELHRLGGVGQGAARLAIILDAVDEVPVLAAEAVEVMPLLAAGGLLCGDDLRLGLALRVDHRLDVRIDEAGDAAAVHLEAVR